MGFFIFYNHDNEKENTGGGNIMYKKIVLELKEQNKIRYEEFKNFDKSHFNNVYKQAVQITEKILQENEAFYEKNITGNDERNMRQIYNMISFVGDRGSGKTSSMLSFAEFLRDYPRCHENAGEFSLGKSNKLFTVLDYIEASILEKNEDVFEVILAQMLSKFEELDQGELFKGNEYEIKKRNLYEKFNKMYQSINIMRFKEKYMEKESDTPLQKLKKLSVTYNLKKEFTSLVNSYIEIIRFNDYREEKFSSTDCFIVIPIDDIDVNIENCYEILEQIHRYLLVPNIIILLTYSEQLIIDDCEMHYVRAFKDLQSEKPEGYFSERAEVLVRDYFEKMLPNDRKIAMPYLPDEMDLIMIRDGKADRKVKQAIFKNLWERLGVLFFVDESRMHVLEPKVLRDLSNFYASMKSQEKISQDGEINFDVYEDNYKWFLNELTSGFARKRMSDGQRKKMRDIIIAPMEEKIKTTCLALEKEYDFLKEKNIDRNYIGMLVRLILIRRQKNFTEKDKEFADWILVYFTFIFADWNIRLKEMEKLEKEKEEIKEIKEIKTSCFHKLFDIDLENSEKNIFCYPDILVHFYEVERESDTEVMFVKIENCFKKSKDFIDTEEKNLEKEKSHEKLEELDKELKNECEKN